MTMLRELFEVLAEFAGRRDCFLLTCREDFLYLDRQRLCKYYSNRSIGGALCTVFRLQNLGLTEDEAVDVVVRGMLR